MERFTTFTLLIAKINRSIRKIKNEEMKEFGLKSPHVSCLYHLYKKDGLTAKELADVCDEDKAAISRSIVELEKQGYILCQTKDKKRYKAPLLLTEAGKDIGGKIVEKIDSVLDFVGKAMPDNEREEFYDSLIAISDNLYEFCEKYNQ